MILSPAQNLVGFVSSRPPLVIFILCLATFALTTFSLAFYVRTHDNIQNPDVKLDWNRFLEEVSKKYLCISNNQTSAPAAVSPTSKPHTGNIVNASYTFQVNVTLVLPSTNLLQEIQNSVTFLGVLDDSGIQVQLDLSNADVNSSACVSDSCTSDTWQTMCVTLRGPARLFPSKPARGPKCHPSKPRDEKYHPFVDNTDNCRDPLQMRFQYNPSWTIYLTRQDHSIIDLHLMHTTYFLLATVITLLCYATIRGKPRGKSTLADKSLLDGHV